MGDDHDSIGVWGGVVKYWAWYWVWYGVADTAWHGMVFDKALVCGWNDARRG